MLECKYDRKRFDQKEAAVAASFCNLDKNGALFRDDKNDSLEIL